MAILTGSVDMVLERRDDFEGYIRDTRPESDEAEVRNGRPPQLEEVREIMWGNTPHFAFSL